jgi:hypothetical protein
VWQWGWGLKVLAEGVSETRWQGRKSFVVVCKAGERRCCDVHGRSIHRVWDGHRQGPRSAFVVVLHGSRPVCGFISIVEGKL